MKVLVTGSGGFFGSWLVPGLQAAGHEVVGFDLADGQDIQDAGALAQAMTGCEAVIHLAAYPHYRPEIPAQRFERRNIIGTAQVVSAMRKAGVKRLVYTSSGALYGFGQDRPLEGWVRPPISEAQQPTDADWHMIDAYGGSKLASERWLEALCQYTRTLTVTSLRINCIEPHHQGAKDTGAHWGWYCMQATAARAYLAALERARPGYEAVNVGEPNPNLDTTKLELLEAGKL